jgi:serine/threonine protein kinase
VAAFAHAHGVVHRDLKPSNVMVGQDGRVYLLDWGLVLEFDNEEMEASEKDKLSGTLIYMAPELFQGSKPSVLTEIYSLGLILYQMLTLRYPFHRETVEQYFQNRESEVLLDPIKAAPGWNIPLFLSKIALKCLSETPAERYQSVDEIIAELEKNEDPGQILYVHDKEQMASSAMEMPVSKTEIELHKEQLLPCRYIDNKKLATLDEQNQLYALSIHLGLLQKKPEIIEAVFTMICKSKASPMPLLIQALLSLIKLGELSLAKKCLNLIKQQFLDIQALAQLGWIQEVMEIYAGKPLQASFLDELPKKPTDQQLFPLHLLLEHALKQKETHFIANTVDQVINDHKLTIKQMEELDAYLINAYKQDNNFEAAKSLEQLY